MTFLFSPDTTNQTGRVMVAIRQQDAQAMPDRIQMSVHHDSGTRAILEAAGIHEVMVEPDRMWLLLKLIQQGPQAIQLTPDQELLHRLAGLFGGAGTALMVPIAADGECFGTMVVFVERGLLFADDDLALLALLAHQAALALDESRQFAAMQRLVAERETLLKQAQASNVELEQARTAAERANHAKSEFLSRMSHELRTPLNAVLGFAQLLSMDPLTEEQQDSINHILKAGHHLLGLINEVLDIARVEAGRLSMSPEPVEIAEVVSETLDLIQPLAAGRNIHISRPVPGGRTIHVHADRQRIKQVLINLLSNGVKYNSPGGRVTVSWEQMPFDRLRIHVRDTGPGIAPQHLDRLFVPFDRINADQTGEEGTGLGLALSQRLAEAMGGTLSVESTLGEGSIFTLDLRVVPSPVAQARVIIDSTAVQPMLEATDEVSHCVLYVEDNLSNLTLIERVLGRRHDIRLIPAMQGRVGLELAREHRPDAILLDVHLPDILGDEVLRQLKREPATRDIPVVVISADATPRQIERLMAAGAQDYLTKPLDVNRLLAVLDQTLDEVKEKNPQKALLVGV